MQDQKYGINIPTIVVLLSLLVSSSIVLAQEAGADAPKEGFPAIMAIFLICLLPFFILAFIGIAYSLAYPFMLLYAAIFSGRNLSNKMSSIVDRESEAIAHFGRDPLSTLRGDYTSSGVEKSGLIYSSVVFGPSHWHLLIAWFSNIIGGRIDILTDVIAAARAEAKQRLREQARLEGWDEVMNVRIDTAEMTPASAQKVPRAVEVFAYGTGIKYG